MKYILGFISLSLYCGSFYLLRDIEWSQFLGVVIFAIAAVTAFAGNEL